MAPRANAARRPWRLIVPAALAMAAAAAAIIAGCSANPPFDPATVPNQRPSVHLFVGPIDPNGVLNPTSYYRRTFRWSGTDADGWVKQYYVSVQTQAGVAAAWDTTQRTDTTMTFQPDDLGNAQATFLLVCRDDRGALSDTVRQFVPLRNFPPAVNFQSDFNPLRNLQREFHDASGAITTNPSAAADTTYFNWGPMNFRLFALDLDGAPTMDEFYRYTLADGDPGVTLDEGDPAADPNTCWVRVPFNSSAEIKQFSIFVKDVVPGIRTLRVSVKDEAHSDANFRFTWEVRAPKGPVLFIADGMSPDARAFFTNILDSRFGVGGWDEYNFWFGAPDIPSVLLETYRKFQVVFWTDSGAGSQSLKTASAPGGVLQQYMVPSDGAPAGRFLFVSRGFVGQSNGLTVAFLQAVVGVSPTSSPATPLRYPIDKAAIHQSGSLFDMVTAKTVTSGGQGLAPLSAWIADGRNEILYRMESCTCYGDPRRPLPPYDPVVGIRVPSHATSSVARMVGLSLQLDNFNPAHVSNVIYSILTTELGVVAK